MPDLPTSDQIKDTITAGQQAWAAVEHFMQVAVWVGPCLAGIAAHLSAWSTSLQKIPGFNLIAGNYGKAKNAD